jgi:hypothetical protein
MFHIFFNLAFKVKKIAMHPNQVLKIVNVAHWLLKSVFLCRNRFAYDTCRFLRAILPEIYLKKSVFLFFLKKKIEGWPPQRPFWSGEPPPWPMRGVQPPPGAQMGVASKPWPTPDQPNGSGRATL